MADHARGIAYPLYERVNADRAGRGWTWTRLSERSGVARTTILNWAKLATPPQPGTVNAVADELDIPREEALRLAGILSDRPEENSAELVPECEFERRLAHLEPDERILIIIYRRHRDDGHAAWCNPDVKAAIDEPALAARA